MTTNEQNLLLYVETRAVDHRGRLDQRHLNGEDVDTLTHWVSEGRIESGQITAASGGGTWVHLPPDLMAEAHRLRAERAERCWGLRRYTRTCEGD